MKDTSNFIAAIRAAGGIFATALLVGCAAPNAGSGGQTTASSGIVQVPKQPTIDAREQGVVVAAIAGSALAANYHQRLWFLRAVVRISGTSYFGAVRDGYLVLPLKAGEYELENVQAQKNPSDKQLTSYPLNYKFRVQAGRATNLGLIALVRGTADGKFLRTMVENNAEMTARLRREQPELFKTLDKETPVVAAADMAYLKPQAIEQLRREIARDAFTRTDNDISVVYTFGEVGTIAKTVRDSQQRVVGFEALQTGTTARMFSCAGQGDRFVCSSDEPALHLVRGTKVERIVLPAQSQYWWVEAFPPAAIVLVDENMSIYRSHDDGRTWNKSSWFTVKQPLAPTTRIKAHNGKSGFYLYTIDKIDALAPIALFSSYARDNYRKIDLPDLSIWDSLIEVGDALAVGPVWASTKEKSVMYVRPVTSDRWEERQLPDASCLSLQRAGDNGDMTVLCARKRYRSHDLGKTWWPEDGTAAASVN